MSTQLQSMAGALDEWTGGRFGAAEVSDILTKAMLGENEQLKTLGIAIRKDSEEFTSLVKIKMQDATVTKAQAEAMATLELIQKKSADAQTAYTQEGNKLLRLQKGLSRGWRQMMENMVTYFDESASEKLIKEQKSVNSLAVEMTSANTTAERRNSIYEQLKTLNPKIVEGFTAENIEVSKLKDNMKAYNDEMVTRIVMARLSAEEEEAISKAATKGADARMRELSISEKMANINKDIAFSGDDFNTKLEKTIAYLIEQGAQMDEVSRKSNIQVDRQGVINDSRSKEQKQLDEIMVLTSSRNIMLEQQKELEGDVSGIQERLKIAKELLGVTKNENINGNEPVKDQIKTIPILKKELEALKTARDKINITNEAALLQNQKEIEAKEALIKKYEDFGKTITKSLKDKKKAETVAFASSLYFANEEAKLRENMATEQQTAREEDLKAIEDKYKREKVLAETKYNEELLALGTDEEAKKALKTQFEADELQRNLDHLNALKTQMEQTVADVNLEDSMLTDEERDALLLKIEDLKLAISELNLAANQTEDTEGPGVIAKMLFGINDEDSLAQKIQKIGDFAVKTFSSINQIISNGEQRQLQEFEAANNKKKAALETRLNSGSLSQEKYAEQVAALDEELDKKKRKIAHDEAVRAKAIAIMQTIINTAASIVEASPVIPMRAMAAVVGAIQLGVVASTPVPALASGNRQKILADDGKTYNARIAPSNRTSGMVGEPTFIPGLGLVGETPTPELVFNPSDTQKIIDSPALIDAINMTLGSTPQYAQGNSTEIIKETNTVTNSLPESQVSAMNRFSDIMERMVNEGIEANLMTNEDYIRKHKKVINEYDTFKSKVSG
jgi:hypothetical protein